MKNINPEVINKSMNYKSYRLLIDALFSDNKTTGPDQSDAMLNYTKMNMARMKRLDKTTRLAEETIDKIKSINKPTTWLVLTEAWCGDAAQIIPVMQKMAELNENIELRMILRDEHLDIMDAFLTNGGRSIPKLISLDAETQAVLGSWGPRPKEVQQMLNNSKNAITTITDESEKKKILDGVKVEIQRWYAHDKTQKIQQELSENVIKHFSQVPQS